MSEYSENERVLNALESMVKKRQNNNFIVGVLAKVTAKDVGTNTLTIQELGSVSEIVGAKIPEYMDISTININDVFTFLNMNNTIQGSGYVAFLKHT